ncbi:MAG: translocation/assembly module TamB domain-containing protein, partial [Candidatus Margulisbacteria bacterium]|nr:translocation/assembly module TamB domain-containing protein [Candidatus Margulisiibacteriota bacterium]
MKKKFLLLVLALVVITTSAFSLKEWQESIYQQIKTETIKGLKDAFNTDISVGKVEGLLVGQVVFEDVVIPKIAKIKKIYVNYNLIKFAAYQDIVPAISKITIVNGEFEVIRSQDDQLNVLSLLPQENPGGPAPPPFRAKIVFQNCRVNYVDHLGFRGDARSFSETIYGIKGTVSFSRADRISLSLKGQLHQNLGPTPISLSGSTNLATGQYAFSVAAKKVGLGKWGNYVIPFEPLVFTGGEADIALKLLPAKTPGWPLSLTGNFNFHDASGQIGGYKIDKTYGLLSLVDDSLALKDAQLRVNNVPLTVNGRYSDFVKHNLDFQVQLKAVKLKDIVALFPATQKLDLQGKADASAIITGTASSPQAKGTVNVLRGKFYSQDFAGKSAISFKNNVLSIEVPRLELYQGRVTGNCLIDFNLAWPSLSLKAKLDQLDLGSLAQNSPGIVGLAKGELYLAGPLNDLQGDLSASLSQAMFFGQPLDNLAAIFVVKDGDILLETLSATSKTASLRSSGKISQDLFFDLRASAQGIKLSGVGWLGKMETTVDNFQGDIKWQLDEKFFASPLKNLEASGEVSLSQGKIGEQQFDLAQGKLAMGQGLIRVDNLILSQKQSVLQASGQTGIGHPTSLKLSGQKIDLSDLKILNYLLPEEAKDPTGQADIALEIFGLITKEAQITSFDPLLDLNASGEISLYNTNIAEIPISSSQLDFLWQDRRLSFPHCSLLTANSNLTFSLLYEKEKIAASASGILDFYEFRQFTSPYGRLNGKLGLNLLLAGNITDPEIGASFWLENFQFNKLDFNSVEGSLAYSKNTLSIAQPLLFENNGSRYEVTGLANLAALKKNQPDEVSLDLNIKVIEGNLASVINLSEKIRAEYSRKAYAPESGGKVKIDLKDLSLPTFRGYSRQGRINFYSTNGKNDSFLKAWESILKQTQREEAADSELNMGGDLAGNIYLKGMIKKLSGRFEGQVRDGHYHSFSFDSLKAKASLADNQLKIDSLELNKDKGKLSAQGKIGFDNTIALDLTAQNMSLDILRLVFNKEYKGTFNMNASFSGALDNPDFTAAFAGSKLSLAEVPFDKAAAQISKRNNQINIPELSFLHQNQLSKISGWIDLSAGGRIKLKAALKGNAVGLFNLITDDIKWRQGQATASLEVNGTLEDLAIDGTIKLDNAVAYVRLIDGEIRTISGEATIKNSQLQLPALTGIWQGQTSKGYPNFIGLAGSADLSKILATQRRVKLNLAFSPTILYIDLPNLYSGVLTLTQAALAGPLYFDFSQGPLLTGQAEIDNAVITLAKKNQRQGKTFPLNLDLALALKKNVYASMGDVATLDLSNIFMNLEINSPQLKISGNLESPSLLGKVFLKRGTVTIFNREFTLLSTELQKKYYPYNAEKVKDNVAMFTGEDGKEGTMPDVSIAAKVEVENQTEANGQTIMQKVIILSRLQGVIGAVEKDRGLKVDFDSFVENENKELVAGGYSEQEIKVMLLPDFIKSLAGVGQGDESEVDANAVVADYLSSRLQTVVFRGLERELEQKLGLESLTLEYNFGKDVRQAMGISERRALET